MVFSYHFDHVERMEKDRIAKKVYVGECAGICSLGRLQKRGIETMKDCLWKKRFGCQASKGMIGMYGMGL